MCEKRGAGVREIVLGRRQGAGQTAPWAFALRVTVGQALLLYKF